MVGRCIRAARQRAGFSQVRLSKALRMSRASVVNIEAGRQHPPLHVLWRIAGILGIEPSDLIPGLDEYEAGQKPLELDKSTVKQIEAAANGDVSTKRKLMDFIGTAKRQLDKDQV